MNLKNDWMIAAPLLVSLISMRPAGVAQAQARAVVSVQKSEVKADYTAGSAGKAGLNVGRGQQIDTGTASRAATGAMIQGDPVNADADDLSSSTERIAEWVDAAPAGTPARSTWARSGRRTPTRSTR